MGMWKEGRKGKRKEGGKKHRSKQEACSKHVRENGESYSRGEEQHKQRHRGGTLMTQLRGGQ